MVITSTDPNLKINIKLNGKNIKQIELKKDDNLIRVRTGQYEIELAGDYNGIGVVDGNFTLTRGDRHVVTISRLPSSSLPAREEPREGPSSSATADKRRASPTANNQLPSLSREGLGEGPAEPISETDSVARPAKIKGLKSWTIVPRKSIGGMYALTHSPDSRLLAGGDATAAIRIWNASDGTLQRILVGHSATIQDLAFSPDGKILASASSDKTARLWDVTTGRLLQTLRGHTGVIYSLAWSADGQLLATEGSQGKLRLWDATTGKLIELITVYTGPNYHRFAFSPTGRTLALNRTKSSIDLYDLDSGQWQSWKTTLDVCWLAFSPDGKRLAVGSRDHLLQILEVASGEVLHSIATGHSGLWLKLAWSPKGNKIGTISHYSDSVVKLWDTQTGQQLAQRKLNIELICLSWAPNGRSIALTGHGGYSPIVLDADLKGTRWTVASYRNSIGLRYTWTANSKALLTSDKYGKVMLWDPGEASAARLLIEARDKKGNGLDAKNSEAVWSADKTLLARGMFSGQIEIYDAQSGKLLQRFHDDSMKPGDIIRLAWIPDSKQLAAFTPEGTLLLWNADTPENCFGSDRPILQVLRRGWQFRLRGTTLP